MTSTPAKTHKGLTGDFRGLVDVGAKVFSYTLRCVLEWSRAKPPQIGQPLQLCRRSNMPNAHAHTNRQSWSATSGRSRALECRPGPIDMWRNQRGNVHVHMFQRAGSPALQMTSLTTDHAHAPQGFWLHALPQVVESFIIVQMPSL